MATLNLFLVWLALFSLGSAQDPPGEKFKLEGVVVDSLTGRPLARALVVLPGSGAMLSGPQGEFSFSGVASGTARLTVTKPGYFSPGEKIQSGPQPIGVSAGRDRAVVKLIPQCVIAGRVTGKDGDPLEGAVVQVLTYAVKHRGRQLTTVPAGATTDEDGNFRIAGLPEGRYFLAVRAGNVSRRILGAQSATTSEGYQALVYSPGTTDFAGATALDLAPGQRLEVNLSLTPVAMFKVAGTVAVTGEWKHVNAPAIVDQLGQQLFMADKFDRSSGVFEFKAVPAGSYLFRTSGTDKDGLYLNSLRSVGIEGAVPGLKLSLQPGTDIPVIVRTELSQKTLKGVCRYYGPDGEQKSDCSDYPAATVELTAATGAPLHFFTSFKPLKDPSVDAVRAVMPGRYLVQARAMTHGYIQSVRSGGLDLMREPLVVQEGLAVSPIEIVVRDDFGALKIHVRKDKPEQIATVVIWNDDTVSPEPRVLPSTREDEISSGLLAPGRYRIFAFEGGEGRDYTDPEVLRRYSSTAASATLNGSDTVSVTVDLIQAGD